ncbi:MAG: PP2C family protein-serine/threonine phosphatase [Cuniculiplasma sp.]
MIFKNSLFLIDYSIYTENGLVRRNNEDSAIAQCLSFITNNKIRQIFNAIICDGVGGMINGEVASRLASVKFSEKFNDEIYRAKDEISLESIMKDSILYANRAIRNINRGAKFREYMATTLTSLAIVDDKLAFVNSGDSEIFFIHEHIRSITEIHREPISNYLTSCLGVDDLPEVHSGLLELKAGDIMVMCSDGLSDMLDVHQIENIVIEEKLDSEEAVNELVKQAMKEGGQDNITVLVCKIKNYQ